MSSLTTRSSQWTMPATIAAITIQRVIFFQNAAGTWIATTNPTDATGLVTGILIAPVGIWSTLFNPTYGAGPVTTGLNTVVTPTLNAYS